jgi:CheY-like chemotaxis protein/HPt (histidine-containing phosphotransfer) domain-containing protein
MGGTIDVESEYGKGSVFTLTIPQSCDEYQKLAEVLDPRKKRVLFMEENAVKASSLRYAFTGLGISPFHAENFDIFREELKRGVHDYAFTASKYAVESVRCISDMKRGKPQIVAMVDMGDTAIYGYGIKNILRPIYCVDVANILNGVVDERNVVTDKKQGLFSASSAVALVADDVSTNLRVSKELLQLYGMEVHTCMSGAEAIELVAAKRYDIVFMDHMMPGMDGTEATKIIRALGENDPYFTALPIIALTANAVSGAREIFLENGMNDFLSKPIEIQRLTEILKKWLPGEKQAEAGDSPQEQGTFTIPGVSVDIGLRHIEWNMRMYKEILRDFCADASECADRIRENLRAGNIQEYRVSVHGIKGAARSIGAVEFARFAQELEDAAKAGERAALDEKTEEFLLTLQTLTANIKGALLSGDTAETPCVEPDTAHLHLDSLKEALIDMDAGTINDMLLKYMELSDGTKIRESIREIEQHILSFEYDKAIEKIDGILRQSEPG